MSKQQSTSFQTESPGVLCVIPARYASTRLPGKPLADIGGKPLIMWALDSAVASGAFAEVCVATDDERIFDAVTSRGGLAEMTSVNHQRGTDRVNEVAQRRHFRHVVNLQGDEPELPGGLLRDFCKSLIDKINDNCLLTSVSNATIEHKNNPNVVKAVLNNREEALYFSRAPIPYDATGNNAGWYRHTGIYGFTKGGLARFCSFSQGILERCEQLEQLRALENGMTIACLIADATIQGIDTPADLERFRSMIKNRLNT
jgi:3-deoxy-manno-octulosonate cytidylyltransferase (CMP-KDO synthetase)